MKKANQTNLIGTVLGIMIGVILNAYLMWDVSYYGFLGQHSPMDFIWRLQVYFGEGEYPLSLIAIFLVVQISLTTLYCLLFSTYFVSGRKIIPPSFVLLGATIPLPLITGSISFQLLQKANAVDPMNSSYFLAFFFTVCYFVFMYLTSAPFDQFVRNFVGGYYDEKQIGQTLQAYSSNLRFDSIVELITDRKWIKDYPSLSLIKQQKDEEKGEAFFRLKKIGTYYYLCISVFHLDKENLVLMTFYELHEDRFGKEQNVDDETKEILNSQIESIKKRLELAETTTDVDFKKSAIHFTTQISKVPLERIIPYKLQAAIFMLNIIALLILSCLCSFGIMDSILAIAIYTLILMVSIEFFRLKRIR